MAGSTSGGTRLNTVSTSSVRPVRRGNPSSRPSMPTLALADAPVRPSVHFEHFFNNARTSACGSTVKAQRQRIVAVTDEVLRRRCARLPRGRHADRQIALPGQAMPRLYRTAGQQHAELRRRRGSAAPRRVSRARPASRRARHARFRCSRVRDRPASRSSVSQRPAVPADRDSGARASRRAIALPCGAVARGAFGERVAAPRSAGRQQPVRDRRATRCRTPRRLAHQHARRPAVGRAK